MANHVSNRDRLYELLPAVYRERDAAEGYPLRALLRLVADQAGILQTDIQQLWDNFFIETCERWVIPYIGALVGNNLLHDAGRFPMSDTAEALFPDLVGPDLRPPIAIRTRADVAKTIYYRRRKGTLPMLEELARDVTGWPAHAVEFFLLLGWTQHLNHMRLGHHDCPDLRQGEKLDRLNGPFDTSAHTVDVRRIGQLEGWYNLRNIGFFFWRLQSYPLEGVRARPLDDTAPSEWRYHFSPLGNPAPLFSRWRREGDEAGLATELHIPGPIRPFALADDLARHGALAPPRPDYTVFYGPFASTESSFAIFRDGTLIPPDRIICQNLESWGQPPAGFRGVISGELTLPLTEATPAVNVVIGGEGPHRAELGAVPSTTAEAAALLQAAVREVHSSPAFSRALVVPVDNRLLIIPGTRDDTVSFEAASGDADTVTQLGLDAFQPIQGVLSGRLHPFPKLRAENPEVIVTIGGIGIHLAVLGTVPTNLTDARTSLEDAIRAADGEAQVLIVEDRLLVLPGTWGETMVFGPSDNDATTAEDLKLLNLVGVDPIRGRLTFPLDEEPAQAVTVDYHYGFSADLGGGPYERGKWLVKPELATLHLRVQQEGGEPETFTSLGAALEAWADPEQGKPNAIITIMDNGTYVEPLEIELADDAWLVIQAANGSRPHLQPEGDVIQIVGDHAGAELTLSGLLIEGGIQVTGSLARLRLLHSTLVPGRGLDENGGPDTLLPSLIIEGASDGEIINEQLKVELAFCITGPLRLPEHISGLWVLDSIVDGLEEEEDGPKGLALSDPDEQPGPVTTLERVTILGSSTVKQLTLASEVIFSRLVEASRRQEGCVRFSFVPPGSQTPRRYRCQPDLEIAGRIDQAEKSVLAAGTILSDEQWEDMKEAIRAEVRNWLVPSFTAERYGLPGYGQLHLGCPLQIRRGAEDESEMGVFCHLKQTHRETNLRIRLEEYLPFGLEAGLIYVT